MRRVASSGDEDYLAGDVTEAMHHVVEGLPQDVIRPAHLDLPTEVPLRHCPHHARDVL